MDDLGAVVNKVDECVVNEVDELRISTEIYLKEIRASEPPLYCY